MSIGAVRDPRQIIQLLDPGPPLVERGVTEGGRPSLRGRDVPPVDLVELLSLLLVALQDGAPHVQVVFAPNVGPSHAKILELGKSFDCNENKIES